MVAAHQSGRHQARMNNPSSEDVRELISDRLFLHRMNKR
jgi:hypothetical protein